MRLRSNALALVAALLGGGLAGCPTAQGGPPQWEDERIDHGDQFDPEPESSPPVMCVSGRYVYVAWHDDRASGTNNIYLQVSQDGGDSWNQTDLRLNANPEGLWVAENPALACDEQAVYVVWEDDRDGDLQNKAIYFNASYDAGGTWFESDVNLTDDDEGDWNSLDAQIVMVGSDLYVTYYDGRDGAYDIYATHSTDWGATWADEQRIDRDDEGAAYSAKPRMVADASGNVHVVWEDLRNGTNDIYYNRSADFGAHWGAGDIRLDVDQERTSDGDVLAAAPAESFGASIGANDSGLVAVAWHDLRNGEFSDIYVAISNDGGLTFFDPLRLDAATGPGISDSLYPDVLVAGGEVLVAYRDDRHDLGFDIFFTRSTDGGQSFVEEQAVDTDEGTSHSIAPQLASNEDGTVVIAWTDLGDPSRGDWEDILFNVSTDSGQTWGDDETRVDNDEVHTARSIGMQMELQGDDLYFAWSDYRLGAGDIFFRTMAL